MYFLLFANKGEREVIILCDIFPDIVLIAALKHILLVHSLIWGNVDNVTETKITKAQMAMIPLVSYFVTCFVFPTLIKILQRKPSALIVCDRVLIW